MTMTENTSARSLEDVTGPLILDGNNVVSIPKTESGNNIVYLLPLLHKLLSALESNSSHVSVPAALVLVPNTELIQQVYSELMSVIELYRVELKVAQLTSSMSSTDLKQALSGPPDVLVSTPAFVLTCLSIGALQPEVIQESLPILILDETHLLSNGYEDDLKAFMSHVSKHCQCLVMSADSSDDHILKVGNDEIIPNCVDHFWISCDAQDNFFRISALLKLDLILKKVLLFTNTIDAGIRLKLFLEKFAIRSTFLNAELPQNSRLHIIEEFNAGSFDCLIVTGDGETNTKEPEAAEKNDAKMKKGDKRLRQTLDTEFGVVEGIDFKNVYTVIAFHMPSSAAGYIHRIGCTGPRTSIFLVSPDEMEAFEELKSTLAELRSGGDMIAPFPLLKRRAVESLRYRAQDIERTVTGAHVRKVLSEAKLGTKIENVLGSGIETVNLKFV